MPDKTKDYFNAESFAQKNIAGQPDPKALSRGERVYERGQAEIVELSADEASVEVWDDDFQTVYVWLSDGRTYFECECPEGRDYAVNFCKHKVAAMFALRDEFGEEIKATWRDAVRYVADVNPHVGQSRTDIIGFCLQPQRRDWAVVPVSIPADLFAGIDPLDVDAVRKILPSITKKKARFLSHGADGSRYANSTDVTAAVCRMLVIKDGIRYAYSGKGPQLPDILPLLRHCLTFVGSGSSISDVVAVEKVRAYTGINVENSAGGLRVFPFLRFPDEIKRDIGELIPICDRPPWYLSGGTLFEVEPVPPSVERLMSTAPDFIQVSADEADEFFRDYLPRLADRAPIQVENVKWVDVEADAVPRIYLDDSTQELVIRLRFAYEGNEVGWPKPLSGISIVKAALPGESGETVFFRIRRSLDVEHDYWTEMLQHGLKTGGESDTFALRARVQPLDFLLHHVPKLLAAGYEVYGQDELKTIRVNRNRPSIRLSVSSGIDWFDVDAAATFGDVELPLASLYEAIRKREKFVKLADGSIGAIPPEWIERYRHLFALAEKKGDTLRVAARQQILIEDALAQAEHTDVDAGYAEKRERLRGFENIDEVPLPKGFVGELRHYQKAGFDWLHFLHAYRFGGCLADDMGIGKTVQTLVFLLSLKETKASKAANLIVMPRSLLFNWEREAAKFTPGLKVLIHSENRTKVAEHFEDYDLVLTTYGVLLRDIEMLRKYKFHYAILDESQAIKNPLAQTGRAARLLNSDHRLVLTGTPVENSTIELWSQFAFLNPGMLGGIDYFRDEFAAAIERGNDPQSAQLLKKMVFPFILRRTKDQVAPELPPRTERILYAEMEEEQKKLYEKTRQEYRAEILSLIDQKGMNTTRMRVLEALLRLRQIANHPKLVDPKSEVGSSKFDLLLETLATVCSENHKALVFSQFVSMLSLVRTELDGQKLAYAYLDGRTRNRQERVDDFQNRADLPLFLISLKAGGVGLNLTAADYVVHIDPWWNPAVERQATDRTHRIGQDKPVFVYKLITRGTVEEKILELQDRKRALADTLISTEESFFKTLTADDVAALLG